MNVETVRTYSWTGKEIEDVLNRLGIRGSRLESINSHGTGGEPYLEIKMVVNEDDKVR